MKNCLKILVCLSFMLGIGGLRGQAVDTLRPSSMTVLDSLSDELEILRTQVAAQRDTLRQYEATIQDYGTVVQARQREIIAADPAKEDTLGFLRRLVRQLLTQDRPDFSARITAFQNAFDVYVVDTRKRRVRFYLHDKKGKNYRTLKNVKDHLESQKESVRFATNGGMYTPSLQPQGLYIEEGAIVTPLDTLSEGYGNFYLQPNGVFYLTEEGMPGIVTTSAFDTMTNKIAYATQSGPMLVINGEHHPIFTHGSKNKYIRSGVGLLDEHRLVFAISKEPVNFHDFASLFVDYFQCRQALYLDGAISQTYQPDLNRIQLGGPFGPIISISSKSID